MKYALIGCGRISPYHIKAAKANNLTIVALCDLVPDLMESLVSINGLNSDKIRLYTDYHSMLLEQKPDLVAIATESGCHGAIALDCIKTGCHVIIEKPITLSLQQADQIIELAKEYDVKVCACHQNRFNIAVQHLRKAVDSGRFGKLSHGCIHVRWNRSREYYAQAPWRGTWLHDGGALMNQSIHGIDLLRWIMGDDIDEVFAYTAQRFHNYLECEDLGTALVKFKDGAIGVIEGTTNIYPKNLEETLYVFGQHGTVKLGGRSTNTIEIWEFKDPLSLDGELANGLIENTETVYGNGHPMVYQDMIEAIRTNRAPYISAEAGKNALELVLAIYRSSATGLPVKLPLSECDAADFMGMFD